MSTEVLILAMMLMVVQDMLGVFLVVSEAKGRGWLAGLMDGLGDWPRMLGAGISGATLAQKGFGPEFILVTFVSLTSVFSTKIATDLSKKIKTDPESL